MGQDAEWGSAPTNLPCIADKFDIAAVERLIAMGYPQNAEALPHLLEWIQDMNWPVARVIAPYLASLGTEIIPALLTVFEGDDLTWQYWCITDVIAELPQNAVMAFVPLLQRLSQQPTKAERTEHLDEVAQAVLAQLGQLDGGERPTF